MQELYRRVYQGIAESIQEIQEMEQQAEAFSTEELEQAKEILTVMLSVKKTGGSVPTELCDIAVSTDKSVSEICDGLENLFGDE